MHAWILSSLLLTCVFAGACHAPRQAMAPRSLPDTVSPLVIRTEFGHEREWKKIRGMVHAPVQVPGNEFYAHVEFLDDITFRGLSKDALVALVPQNYSHAVLFVVDGTTVGQPEFPILVVDLHAEKGRSFRAIPTAIQSIENNISIANMDFFEFANAVERDGVFRGFPRR